MDALLLIIGLLLVFGAVTDVFRELFQPAGRGRIGHAVARACWRILRRPARRSPAVAALVGPIILVLILATWLVMTIVGWALVFMPAIDTGAFVSQSGESYGIVEALYLSLVTISTLGFGDLVPTADWARLVVPLEALFGLGVAAGTIGWLFNVQSVLSHRAKLAARISLLQAAEDAGEERIEDIVAGHDAIMSLADQLTSVHADLLHVPVSYFFLVGEDRHSLPDQLGWLQHLARRSRGSSDPLVRLQGRVLDQQLRATLHDVASSFLPRAVGGDDDAILAAWRRDHAPAVARR